MGAAAMTRSIRTPDAAYEFVSPRTPGESVIERLNAEPCGEPPLAETAICELLAAWPPPEARDEEGGAPTRAPDEDAASDSSKATSSKGAPSEGVATPAASPPPLAAGSSAKNVRLQSVVQSELSRDTRLSKEHDMAVLRDFLDSLGLSHIYEKVLALGCTSCYDLNELDEDLVALRIPVSHCAALRESARLLIKRSPERHAKKQVPERAAEPEAKSGPTPKQSPPVGPVGGPVGGLYYSEDADRENPSFDPVDLCLLTMGRLPEGFKLRL